MLRIFILAGCVLVASAAVLPKDLGLEICRWKDPEIQACMKRAVQSALPKLKNGVPGAGIPKLEPLEVSEMAIDFGNSGPVNLKLKLNDVKIYGTTETKVPELNLDQDKEIVTAKLSSDKIVIKGIQNSEGKLLGLPIKNTGEFEAHFKNIVSSLKLYFKTVTRKGVKYWSLEDMGYEVLDVGGLTIKMGGSKGNKPLELSLNAALNESTKELDEIMRPVLIEAIRQHYMFLARRFLQKIPLSELFPDK